MARIVLERLTKVFPRREAPVLAGIDLVIEDGELVSLVGPSGCGKSTLLSIVAGLENPTAGRVEVDGVDVTARDPGARDLAMVFQSYALYPHMTVAKNVAFPLENQRLPRKEIDARVRETAALLGIEALLGERPRALSGGQRQRVALARALVRRPKAFLFDEPLSNLDAALRAQMRAELKRLHAELRATFLYVTHDQVEAMTLSDRIVVLAEGRIQQIGTPREIYDRPANVFVAGFFGSPRINLVAPSVLGRPGPEGLVLGMRPEQVEIGVGDTPEGGVPARVFVVEPVGPETFVTVDASGEHVVARAPAGFAASVGDPVWVRPVAEGLWFDGRSGIVRASSPG